MFGVRFPGRNFMNPEKGENTGVPLLGADFETWNQRELYVTSPKGRDRLRKKELCPNSILTASDHILDEIKATMYNYNGSVYARYLYVSTAGPLVYAFDLFALGAEQFAMNRSGRVLPVNYLWTPAVEFSRNFQSKRVLRAMDTHASVTLPQNLIAMLQAHQVILYDGFGPGHAAEALFNTCGLILKEKEFHQSSPARGRAGWIVPVVDLYALLQENRMSIANVAHQVVCRPTQDRERDFASSVFGYGGIPRKTKLFMVLGTLLGRIEGDHPVRREDAMSVFGDYVKAPQFDELVKDYVSTNADYAACVGDLRVLHARPVPETQGSILGIKSRAEGLRDQVLVLERHIVTAVLGPHSGALNFRSPLYALYLRAPSLTTFDYYGYNKGADVTQYIYAKTCLLWDLLAHRRDVLCSKFYDPGQHKETGTPEARFEVRRFMTSMGVIQLENGVTNLKGAHREAVFRRAIDTSLILPLLVTYASGGWLGTSGSESARMAQRSAKALVDRPYVLLCEGPREWTRTVPDIRTAMKTLIAGTFTRIKRLLMAELNPMSEDAQRETLRKLRLFEYSESLTSLGSMFFNHLRGHSKVSPSDAATAMRQLYRDFYEYWVVHMINFPLVKFREGFESEFEAVDVSGPIRTEIYVPYWHPIPPADGIYAHYRTVPEFEARKFFEDWRDSFREGWARRGVAEQDTWDAATVKETASNTLAMTRGSSEIPEATPTAATSSNFTSMSTESRSDTGSMPSASSPSTHSMATSEALSQTDPAAALTLLSDTQADLSTTMEHDGVTMEEAAPPPNFRQIRTSQLKSATAMGILRYNQERDPKANQRHDLFRRPPGFKIRAAMGKTKDLVPAAPQDCEEFDLQRAEAHRSQYLSAMLGTPAGGIFPFQTASSSELPFRKYMHISYGPAPPTQKFEGDYWLKIMEQNPAFYLSHESTVLNRAMIEELCVQHALLSDGIRGTPCPIEGSAQQLRYVDVFAENPVYQFFSRLRKESATFDEIDTYEMTGYATWRAVENRFFSAGIEVVRCPVLKYYESAMYCGEPHLRMEEVTLAEQMEGEPATSGRDTPMIGPSPKAGELRQKAMERLLKIWKKGRMPSPYPMMMPPLVYYATRNNPGPKDYILSRATIGGNEPSSPDVSPEESESNMDE